MRLLVRFECFGKLTTGRLLRTLRFSNSTQFPVRVFKSYDCHGQGIRACAALYTTVWCNLLLACRVQGTQQVPPKRWCNMSQKEILRGNLTLYVFRHLHFNEGPATGWQQSPATHTTNKPHVFTRLCLWKSACSEYLLASLLLSIHHESSLAKRVAQNAEAPVGESVSFCERHETSLFWPGSVPGTDEVVG